MINTTTKDKIAWLTERVARLYQHSKPNASSLEIFVVGSQSVWGKLDPPPKMLTLTEDIDFIPSDYSEELDNQLEFVLGSASPHEEEYGSALDIVEESTICTPRNWKDRTTDEVIYLSNMKVTTRYMDHHDLVFCKLKAAREKDFLFIDEMFRCNLLSPAKLNKILKTEMDHQLHSPSEYKRIEDKLNYYINKHLKPRKQISSGLSIENGM